MSCSSTLIELANKNNAKGRTEAADIQRDTAERLGATIKGSEGAESTPLSKKDADDLAKAFKTDKSGNKTVDEARIDRTLEKTGVTKKVKQAKMMNELCGIGIAAAIGLGTGFTIGFVVSLTLESVVKIDALFRDVWNIPVMENIIRERFPNGRYPARKSFQTEFAQTGGKNGLLFQLDAIAYRG